MKVSGGGGVMATANQNAADVPFTPAGTIAAVEVQAAIEEVASEAEQLANKNQADGYPGLSAGSKITGSQQTYGTATNTAAEGNDSRIPTQAENDALVGTGTPGSGDRFVNESDGRVDTKQLMWHISGNPLTISATDVRVIVPDWLDGATGTITLKKVRIVVNSAPSGGVCTVDITRSTGGGAFASVYTGGNEPSIADGAFNAEGNAIATATALADDEYRAEIDAVNAAGDLTILAEFTVTKT